MKKKLILIALISILALLVIIILKELILNYSYKSITNMSLEKNGLIDYYFDLRYKLKRKYILDNNDIALYYENGKYYYHPVYIIQYGIAHYQNYLYNREIKSRKIYLNVCEWLVRNLKRHGDFYYWEYDGDLKPYRYSKYNHIWFSAMAQGQGASLLIRAYLDTLDPKYFEAAKRAIKGVLYDVSEGGVSIIREYFVFPQEFPPGDKPSNVLNGAITCFLGLYDIYVLTKDENVGKYIEMFLFTLQDNIYKFDNGFWSLYALYPDCMLASPYYHNRHIAQLECLYYLTKIEIFKSFSDKWRGYIKWNNKIKYLLTDYLMKVKRKEVSIKSVLKWLKGTLL